VGAAAGLGRVAGVVVGVPDPAATASFLAEALSFDVRPEDGGAWSVACEGDYGPRGQEAILLQPAPGLELREVVFEASGRYDAGALAQRLRDAGLPAEPRPGGGLAFRDGAGTPWRASRRPLARTGSPSTTRCARAGSGT
jgi:hypothetical protein